MLLMPAGTERSQKSICSSFFTDLKIALQIIFHMIKDTNYPKKEMVVYILNVLNGGD